MRPGSTVASPNSITSTSDPRSGCPRSTPAIDSPSTTTVTPSSMNTEPSNSEDERSAIIRGVMVIAYSGQIGQSTDQRGQPG
jgi:hypothetical protein